MNNNKSKEMNEVLENLTKAFYKAPYSSGHCPTCGSNKVKHDDFRDELSRKEYGISHMCQVCQDDVFNVEDENDY